MSFTLNMGTCDYLYPCLQPHSVLAEAPNQHSLAKLRVISVLSKEHRALYFLELQFGSFG